MSVPAPTRREPEVVRRALEGWLRHRDGEGTVDEVSLPDTTGYSHETILFRIPGRGRFVARVEPTSHTVFPDTDLAREYEIARVLAERTDIPVPSPVGYEEDVSWLGARFAVLEQVEGRVPDDNPPYTMVGWLLESSPSVQEQVWWAGLEAMCRVHLVDPDAAGLSFLRRDELAYWREYARWAAEGSAVPAVVEDGWDRLGGMPELPKGLVWGDSRLGNQMFREGRCVALFDWEMATTGPAELDVGWWLYFDRVFSEGLGVPRPAGFPGREETLERYEQLLGRPLERIEWFEVFAGVRFCSILQRLGWLMERSGAVPEGSGFGTENFATAFLSRQLEDL